MRKPAKVALIIMGAMLVLMVATMPLINAGMDKVKAAVITPVDVGGVADGEHAGSYCVGRWCYNVGVRVSDGKITAVRLLDGKMANFKKISDRLETAIVARQNLDVGVDAYGGASVTGKAFLKAVENAIRTAPQRVNAARQPL